MTEDDFIFAIRSHPFDSSFRDVYSDWLAEHGETTKVNYLRLQREFRDVEFNSPDYKRLAGRERELKLTDEEHAWVRQLCQYTTPPAPVDVASEIPQLDSLRRTVVRLHPHVVPEPIDPRLSKIGGQFLWPDGRAWPTDDSNVPLVPVLQLRRWDFPELDWPDDCDLLQLFWTPHYGDNYLPTPFLFYGSGDDVVGVLHPAPNFEDVTEEFGFSWNDCVAMNVPQQCAVYPERIEEFPISDELYSLLPHADARIVDELLQQADFGSWNYFYHLSMCPGWTLGGLDADFEDGRNWQRLGTFTSSEFDIESQKRWHVFEDQRGRQHWKSLMEPTKLVMGRYQDLAVWVCLDGELPNVRTNIYFP